VLFQANCRGQLEIAPTHDRVHKDNLRGRVLHGAHIVHVHANDIIAGRLGHGEEVDGRPGGHLLEVCLRKGLVSGRTEYTREGLFQVGREEISSNLLDNIVRPHIGRLLIGKVGPLCRAFLGRDNWIAQGGHRLHLIKGTHILRLYLVQIFHSLVEVSAGRLLCSVALLDHLLDALHIRTWVNQCERIITMLLNVAQAIGVIMK